MFSKRVVFLEKLKDYLSNSPFICSYQIIYKLSTVTRITITMAFAKITGLIEAAVKDGQQATFDSFITFLGTKIDIDEDMQSYIDEFKKTLIMTKKAAPKGKGKGKAAASVDTEVEKTEKKKRAPSAYNLFIRDKMAELRTAGHKGNLMKLAVEEWKKSKSEASSSSTKETETEVEAEVEAETKKVVKIKKVVEKKEDSDSDSDKEDEDDEENEEEYD